MLGSGTPNVVYGIYQGDDETAGLIGGYDESGSIFVVEKLVQREPQFADLVAYHEYLEITSKRARSSHARAHRRAIVETLLAAKALLHDPHHLHAYMFWWVGAYSAAKVPDPGLVIDQLEEQLRQDRVRKERLLEVITRHML